MPTRGNWKNLFNKDLNFIGVSIHPHPTSGTICIIDFAEKIGKIGEVGDIQIVVQEELPEHVKQ